VIGAIVLAALTAALVAVATLLAGVVVDAARDGDDAVGDVQRYLELSAAAHAAFPPGSLLRDPDGTTSAAIVSLLARKDEAHRGLWASRRAA
jgi:hypothetical protein